MCRSIFVLAAALAVMVGCGKPEPGTQGPIRLGAVLPLTGDIASYGKRAQNGIDLAVNEINAAGGINGRALEVIYEDDKGLPDEAVSGFQKLVSVNKVPVVIGSAASSVTMAVCPLANRHHVVLISPISSSKELTDKGGDYFFRVCPSDAYQSRVLAQWMREMGLKKAGIIYVNNSWGVGLKEEFADTFTRLGGEIVVEEATTEGATNLRTPITKVLAKRPDALFAPTYGKEGGLLLKQLRELGGDVPVFGGDVWSSPELTTSAGEAAEGVYFMMPAESSGEKFERFAADFRKEYGEDPDVYAAYSYDLLNIVSRALIAGNTTGEEIRSYLLEMQPYVGVTGDNRFDANGDVVGKDFARKEIRAGSPVDVSDTEF